MKELLLLVLLLVFTNRVSSQNPLCSVGRGLTFNDVTIAVDTAKPSPLCIRCGYFDNAFILVTSIEDVTYFTGGNPIVNTSDISVTNDGLILDDPGNTFADGTGIVCTFDGAGGVETSYTITIQHLINNPPTLSPGGGDDGVLDITEGSNITLTCTSDSGNSDGDLYQWIHPDGKMTPGSPANSPQGVTLNNINRAESGVYICVGTRTVFPDSNVQSNVTLNVRASPQFCSDNRGLTISGTTIVVETAIPDPVCIRCGYFDGSLILVTSIEDVDYFTGGNLIVNTSDISVTNDGLILDDPGNTFSDGTGIVCTFDGAGGVETSYTIIIQHLINNPPILTPDGGGDRILDVTEGSNITLTCTRDSTNTAGDLYQWIHPDGQVTPGSPANSLVQVTLNNINRAESGVYICVGTRTAFPDATVQSNVTLNVQYSARVLSFTPGNSTVTVNTTLTLNCTYEGNPTPNTASWFHNGTELFPDTDPNLSQTDTDTYSLLQVDFVNTNISGLYACGVNNSIGSDQTESIFIIVQVAPGPVATLEIDSVTETSVTLSWTFSFNGNAKITGVDITYTAVANFSSPHSGSTSTSPNGQQTSIIITGLQPLTTYEFTVTVRNTVSDEVGVSSPITITVQTLPLVLEVEVIGPPNGTVTEGQSVTLECRINTGGEAPDVTWRRDFCFIPRDIVINGSRLTILNANVEDSGEYSCYSRVGTPDEASNLFNLVILPLFSLSQSPIPTTSSLSLSPLSTLLPGKATQGIPVYGQVLIIVILSCVSILSFIINIAQCLLYRRTQNKDKPIPCGHQDSSTGFHQPFTDENCAYGRREVIYTSGSNVSQGANSETQPVLAEDQDVFELYEHLN